MSLHVTNGTSRHGLIALAALALMSSSPAGAQRVSNGAEAASHQPVPPRTSWPSTTAIAVVERGNPVIVEATSDGWVVLTPIGYWAQSPDDAVTRLQLRPVDVRRWTRTIRSALAIALDTAVKTRAQPAIPQLGRGIVHLGASSPVRGGAERSDFIFQRCDHASGNWSVSKAELSDFLIVMDSAAAVAQRGSPVPIPPTLDRPYFTSEVSCSAAPMTGNPSPRFPSSIPASQRRFAEVGVRVVVDTSGIVETGSVTVLPGAPRELERATRDLIARWRFRPGVRGGAPVRQVLSTAITYDPARPERPERPAREPFRYQAMGFSVNDIDHFADLAEKRSHVATSDGWVQLRLGAWTRTGAFIGGQEWFAPDSVDAWATRVLAYVTTDSARVRKAKSYQAERAAAISHPMGNSYEVRYMTGIAVDTGWAPWLQARGCRDATYRGERFDRMTIEQYVAAARAARAERTTPREPTDRAFRRGEVACPATLPDRHVLQEDLPVWRQPRAPIPRSMDAVNARAEVLTSFVVDENGIPKPSTLIAMPGSDPRAVAALRGALDRYRFLPATRSGVPVSSLVLRNWSFEPRPRCRDSYDGIDCPRVYSRSSKR